METERYAIVRHSVTWYGAGVLTATYGPDWDGRMYYVTTVNLPPWMPVRTDDAALVSGSEAEGMADHKAFLRVVGGWHGTVRWTRQAWKFMRRKNYL